MDAQPSDVSAIQLIGEYPVPVTLCHEARRAISPIPSWSSDNAAPQKRESLLIWVDKNVTWLAPGDGRTSRPSVFSDAASQFCLSIKALHKLPLRRTSSMVAILLK
ncbi:hypothetical protein FEV53_15445 [Palleronia caenipelagi]|uniref:Transposase DDE domain-containing protein n=1 Tax=Palleronia caenipelagi TaxID=2489174 RepID=A0A547PNG0_9RHOB|nr:hypothetical protein FEV53_15445 [Palleronia caenipelagi]